MAVIRNTPGFPTEYQGNRFRVRLVQDKGASDREDTTLVDDEIVDPPKGQTILLSQPSRSPGRYMVPVKVLVDRIATGDSVPGKILVTARFRRGV